MKLYCGAARVVINPPLGINRPGVRIFRDPIQAIESDLTATAVVLSNGPDSVVVIAVDLLFMIHIASLPETSERDWDRVIRRGCEGRLLIQPGSSPLLCESKRGRIVNISSVASKLGYGGSYPIVPPSSESSA